MLLIYSTAPTILISNIIFAATQPHVAVSFIFVVLLGFALYVYAGPPLWSKTQVFRETNVPYMSPLKSDIEFGKNILFGGMTKDNLDSQQVEKYGKIFGKFELGRSMLVVAEPELVRDILAKEFNNFYNRREPPGGVTKLLKHTLFFERDKRWREIRALVTPTFSSAKMRTMDGLIWSCLQIMHKDMDRRFAEQQQASAAAVATEKQKPVVEIDAKNYFSTFAMDVIGTVFFGVGIDAITNRDHPFVKYSFAFFARPSLWRILLFLAAPFDFVRTFLLSRGIIGTGTEPRNYFEKIIPQMINERRKQLRSSEGASTPRRDFLSVLIQAREKATGYRDLTATGALNNEKKVDSETPVAENNRAVEEKFTTAVTLSDDEVAGQIFIFLIAGFETTATTIGFLFHELAVNQDIQDRLREEIYSTILGQQNNNEDGKHEHELSYDAVADMPLLDACINETLRLYPPMSRLERECMQDCTLSNGLQVKKGVMIGVPLWYIHRSAENFAEPDTFDPDRFYDAERRAQIKPYTYMPFGQGPRNCVGMRFALLELKMVTAFVVRNYRVVPTEKTVHPPPMQAGVRNLLRLLSSPVGFQKL